jgi:hypothetical protein
MKELDVFISYQHGSQDVMKGLYEKLTQAGYKVWMDIYSMNAGHLYQKIAEGLKNSKIVICAITKSYAQSANCENEIAYAFEQKKKIIALMLERENIGELGGVGFKIANLLRINLYKDKEFLNNGWNSQIYVKLDAQINEYLQESTDSSKAIATNLGPSKLLLF